MKYATVQLNRLALLLLAVGACGRQSRGSSVRHHTLIVAYGADEFPLALNRERLGRYPLNAGICEPLVRLSENFAVEPALANRWNQEGPHAVRFILRRGVTFSDGAPFDARAVAFTLAQSVRNRAGYSFLSDTSVRVIDDTTLLVRTTRPNRRLVDQLVHPTYGILEAGSDGARHPVCTGPFRLAEYVEHDHLTVVRNERYRGSAAPLDTLIFRFIPDESTRMLALRAHDVDVVVDVARTSADALAHLPGVRVVSAPPGAVILMYMNLNGQGSFAQLRDTRLRRAIAMAIDRRAFVANVLAGHASVVSTVNPPRVLGPYAFTVHGVPFEPDSAKTLLQGRRRTLALIAEPGSIDRATVEFVQAELARVGVDVTVEPLDAAAYNSRLNAGAFDLDLEVPNQNDANPAFLLALRWYSGSNTQSAKFMFAGARFDTLVERALVAAAADSARRAAADAMHELVDEKVGAIPLAGISRLYALDDRVRGFAPHPSRLNQDWSRVSLAP